MRHVEPFAGGAAFFFDRAPNRALLCDVNPALIAMYEAIRDDVEGVIKALKPLSSSHSSDRYYARRKRYNVAGDLHPCERAALFIYLNKTCFNGLHRVNSRGEFNVPIGRYQNPRILDDGGLRAASQQLQSAELLCDSFESLLRHARPGDFVYLDPPYEPVSRTANFTAYAKDGFGQDTQTRLRDVFSALHKRRCKLMLSNSDTPFVRELYRSFHIDIVAAPRAINCNGRGRGKVTEVVVRNYR